MNDTRKEFDEWKTKRDIETNNSPIMPFEIWQACQQLNDNRIQQLLAVIEKKDAAINAMLKVAYALPPTTEAEHAIRSREVHDATEGLKEAIALSADDVELVEVGDFGGKRLMPPGTHEFFGLLNSVDLIPEEAAKLYAIQMKGK